MPKEADKDKGNTTKTDMYSMILFGSQTFLRDLKVIFF